LSKVSRVEEKHAGRKVKRGINKNTNTREGTNPKQNSGRNHANTARRKVMRDNNHFSRREAFRWSEMALIY
jgi:hypothetical protein